MDHLSDMDQDTRGIVSDLEKKITSDVMKVIISNKELLDLVNYNNNISKRLDILRLMITAAMAAVIATATFIRSTCSETKGDRSIIFDNDDLAMSLGFLVAMMQNRLANNSDRKFEELNNISHGVTEAVKLFLNIGPIRAPDNSRKN
jgi:uncharacterized membrane protein